MHSALLILATVAASSPLLKAGELYSPRADCNAERFHAAQATRAADQFIVEGKVRVWPEGRADLYERPLVRVRIGGNDCGEFRSWQEAQVYFEASGAADPHGLDADGDGIACEHLLD